MTSNQQIAVTKFIKSAKDYCLFIEKDNSNNINFKQLAKILASLYKDVFNLPDINPITTKEINRSLTNESYNLIRNKIADKIGCIDFYWEVFDSFQQEEPVVGSLIDDLSDIYRDLKNGLLYHKSDIFENQIEANWHWKFTFYSHWGLHLVSCLKAIHQLIINDII